MENYKQYMLSPCIEKEGIVITCEKKDAEFWAAFNLETDCIVAEAPTKQKLIKLVDKIKG